MLKRLSLTCFSILLMASPVLAQATPQARELGKYIQAPMPVWYNEGFTRGHLDWGKMVKDGYTRLEVGEIQNQMKDWLEAKPGYLALDLAGATDELFSNHDTVVLEALDQAVQNVKTKKQFESGFKPEPLKKGEFYVAFDFDETLMTHWYKSGEKGAGWYDLKGVTIDSILRPQHLVGPDYVAMIPGWEKAFLEISQIPGCKGIVAFTAKEDVSSWSIINRLTVGGKPFKSFIKGMFTRNYLSRESDNVKLSKDLRMIDDSLEGVILIDDNLTRIFPKQYKNLREFPKYNPDDYLKAKNETKNAKSLAYFEKLLPVVIDEIKDAAAYSQKHQTSFVDAFYPYSLEGQTEVLMLLKQGYSMADSIKTVREERDMFEPSFHFYRVKK